METGKYVEDAIMAYGNSVLRMAYSYLHSREEAEDIFQETFIRYMQHAPDFESRDHEKAWLLRVSSNLAKNRIKYNRIRAHDELSDRLLERGREDLSYVWDAVKSLPENYREIIHLFYHEGYSTRQIAEMFEMEESTVRVRLNRGRKQLKEILKEEYDFEE